MPLSPYVVVATCKTPACGSVIAFAHSDTLAGPVERGPSKPSEFLYKCGKCGQTHAYCEEDARIEQRSEMPRPTWLNLW